MRRSPAECGDPNVPFMQHICVLLAILGVAVTDSFQEQVSLPAVELPTPSQPASLCCLDFSSPSTAFVRYQRAFENCLQPRRMQFGSLLDFWREDNLYLFANLYHSKISKTVSMSFLQSRLRASLLFIFRSNLTEYTLSWHGSTK